jgi:outer membrane protein OmpA-like peptidoglycan-associated protein
MTSNGIATEKISINAIGEGQPEASNATEEGRQQNRRVQIVARGGSQAANATEGNKAEVHH